jgi:hypothetical protein
MGMTNFRKTRRIRLEATPYLAPEERITSWQQGNNLKCATVSFVVKGRFGRDMKVHVDLFIQGC